METLPETTDKMLTEWNSSNVFEGEIQHRLENWKDFYDTEPTEDQVNMDIWNASHIQEDAYEDFIEYLNEILTERNPDGFWHVIVRNFGWQSRDGSTFLSFKTGTELVQKILPQCDCTFKIYADGEKNLIIRNWHHDSPVGNERYYLKVITEKQFDEKSLE